MMLRSNANKTNYIQPILRCISTIDADWTNHPALPDTVLFAGALCANVCYNWFKVQVDVPFDSFRFRASSLAFPERVKGCQVAGA